MSRALDTLARLRRLELELARRDLAEAFARERAAEDELSARRDAVRAEATLAQDRAVPLAQAFAAWLPIATRGVQNAQHALAVTRESRGKASMAAGMRQGALDAVLKIVEQREFARRQAAARTQQVRLDEAGQGGFKAGAKLLS